MTRRPVFPIDDKAFIANDEFFDEMSDIISSRIKNTRFPLLAHFSRMGKFAEAIKNAEDGVDEMYLNLFLIQFSLVAKFIYPINEQIDTILEKNVEVVIDETE